MAAREMGTMEGVMWVIGTLIVLGIVFYSVGGFELAYNMVHQMMHQMAPSASLSQ
jgi:hypothetical protein